MDIKSNIHLFLILISIFSCSKDDFSNTQIGIETDKENYSVNDTFQLKIIIKPTIAEKTIRFYKDFHNLSISFISREEQLGFHQELKKSFIEGPSPTQDETEYIDDFVITKEKPFVKAFAGKISELNDKIVVEIPELNLSESLTKSYLLKDPTVMIEVKCRAVFGIEEQRANPVEIQLSL